MEKQSSYDIGFQVGMTKAALGWEDLKNAWHWLRKPENAWARTGLGALGGAGLGGMIGGTRGALLGGLGGAGLGYGAPQIKDYLMRLYSQGVATPAETKTGPYGIDPAAREAFKMRNT